MKHHFNDLARKYARNDVPLLDASLTIGQALDVILQHGLGEQIVYFYVVDEDNRLMGVLPTRRLLSTPRDSPLSDVMLTGLVTLPYEATVYAACEFFLKHKLLAIPVVDHDMRLIGVVDIGMFTDDLVALGGANSNQLNDVFETIGFHFTEVRDASPLRAFRFRFPWLTATIASGTLCALISGAFEATLAESLIIAFFLTLVTGLGESVSIQSMTIAIQALNSVRPTFRWYATSLRREVGAALLLGLSSGLLVGLIVLLWRNDAPAALTISLSILGTLVLGCMIGFSIPSLIHALRLDPKIAAGPVTLALTDVSCLLLYFWLAQIIL